MITIKDIAREAGVSIGTVDRVLHGRGRVSPETTAKVKTLVRELGYTTNLFGRTLVKSKVRTIGVLLPDPNQDSGYWRLIAQGVFKARDELAQQCIALEPATYDRSSTDSFERVSATLRQRDVDGLVVAPVVAGLAQRFVSSLDNAIPYAFVDTTVPGMHPLVSIGQPPYRSGVLAASLFDKMIPGPGAIAVIRVYPDDYHIGERVKGLQASLPNRLRAVVYDVDIIADTESVDTVLTHATSELPDLRGIFVTNASVHLSADFLTRKNMAHKVRLIGYDVVAKNIGHLRSGTIDFVISQRPVEQGYRAVYALYRSLVLGQAPDGAEFVPLDIVTGENVDAHV